eukprot:TRINITY_DN71681_c0_g1_i1.p1 TRINITY_DN71681_c0_g1~~TRINITY_DN71681_c0_g1_i1.p1  ORF type:complete len:238 (-),score=33.47 TRINITY_DN71681_c0_g1_i1:294-911(-)
MPRHRPLPSGKILTKWEKFAKARKLKTTKKPVKVWDELTESWKPTYGYNKKQDPDMAIGIHEVKGNEDPMSNYFEDQKQAKKERIADNLLKQEANKLHGMKQRRKANANLDWQIVASQKSTASMGRFDKKIDGDVRPNTGRKKFEASSNRTDKEIASIIIKKADQSNVINPATAVRQLSDEKKRQIQMDAMMDGGRSSINKRRKK